MVIAHLHKTFIPTKLLNYSSSHLAVLSRDSGGSIFILKEAVKDFKVPFCSDVAYAKYHWPFPPPTTNDYSEEAGVQLCQT